MKTAEAKKIAKYAPVWDLLENKRARFLRQVDEAFVELCDDEGKPLPDYRHITQIRVMS